MFSFKSCLRRSCDILLTQTLTRLQRMKQHKHLSMTKRSEARQAEADLNQEVLWSVEVTQICRPPTTPAHPGPTPPLLTPLRGAPLTGIKNSRVFILTVMLQGVAPADWCGSALPPAGQQSLQLVFFTCCSKENMTAFPLCFWLEHSNKQHQREKSFVSSASVGKVSKS